MRQTSQAFGPALHSFCPAPQPPHHPRPAHDLPLQRVLVEKGWQSHSEPTPFL